MTTTSTPPTGTPSTGTAPTDTAPTDPAATGTPSTVTVNGVERPLARGTSVAALVGALLADATGDPSPTVDRPADAPSGVAVALDDAIVPRGLWGSTTVPADARVEVVTAVQGG